MTGDKREVERRAGRSNALPEGKDIMEEVLGGLELTCQRNAQVTTYCLRSMPHAGHGSKRSSDHLLNVSMGL